MGVEDSSGVIRVEVILLFVISTFLLNSISSFVLFFFVLLLSISISDSSELLFSDSPSSPLFLLIALRS